MSIDDGKKRRQLDQNRRKMKEVKSQAKKAEDDNELFLFVSIDLIQFRPHLIYWPNLVTPCLLTKNKIQNDSIFQHVFYILLQITPDIFAETVTIDFKSKTLAKTKEKSVSQWKNIIRLV